MKTLIIGASNNSDRYSYKAAHKLKNSGYEIIPFGVKKGKVADETMLNDWNSTWEVDTVTMYINKNLQREYYDKIIALKPRRVIFNPGTENTEFYAQLAENNILSEEACTLVLLSMNTY